MKTRNELGAIALLGLVTAALSSLISHQAVVGPQHYSETAIVVKVFFSSLNAVLLAGLLLNYARIYRDMPTSTTKVLLIFSSALLFYALSANPLVQLAFGQPFTHLGPFAYIPDIFATLAIAAILRESYR